MTCGSGREEAILLSSDWCLSSVSSSVDGWSSGLSSESFIF